MNIHIISQEADTCLVGVLEVVETHLDGLDYLREEAWLKRANANVYCKYISGKTCFLDWIVFRCFELIRSKLQFRSLSSVSPLPEFIQRRLVFNRHIISEVTQITHCFRPSLNELHVRVHISLAPIASEWACLTIVDEGDIRDFILVFICVHIR